MADCNGHTPFPSHGRGPALSRCHLADQNQPPLGGVAVVKVRSLTSAGLRLHPPPDNIDHPLLALELLDGPLLGSSQRRSVLHLHTSIIVLKNTDELQVEHLNVDILVVARGYTMLWQHLAGNLNMPSTWSPLYASRFDPLGVQKISLRHS